MFDFRYHALSLVAVFVALVLGLLLGVAIGDRGLVSSAENKIKESLRADVRAEQRKVASLEGQLEQHNQFESEVHPLLVGGQLETKEVGIVFLGSALETFRDDVKAALRDSGGTVTGIVGVREPPAATELAEAASGTRYAGLDQGPDLWEAFGFRMGEQLANGGRLITDERRWLFSSRVASSGPFDALVLVRNQPKGLKGDDLQRVTDFEKGFIHGLLSTDKPVAGVEESDADPTQIPWYREHGLSTVDNVDQLAGRAALVFVLAGSNDGAYGVHQSQLLPDIAGGVGG